MNPAKKEWTGEIMTVGNRVIGSVKKFIPFNADDGWHVPYIMYEQLRERHDGPGKPDSAIVHG